MRIHIDNDFYRNLNNVDTQSFFDRTQGLDEPDQGNMNGIKVIKVGNLENKVRPSDTHIDNDFSRNLNDVDTQGLDTGDAELDQGNMNGIKVIKVHSSAQKRRNSATVTEALREVDLVGATGAIKYRKTASETDALICGSDKMSTTIQEDTQKLLQQIIKIKDPLKWQTMFSKLIHRHLIEALAQAQALALLAQTQTQAQAQALAQALAQPQEQKRNLYSIVIKNMTDFINSTPNASENLARIRLNKRAFYNKRLILLFYWKLQGCKTSDISQKINMSVNAINRIINSSQLCSFNLCTLIKSYNNIFHETILSKDFTSDLSFLQKKVTKSMNIIEKLNLIDEAISNADIEVQKIYKESSHFVSKNKVDTVVLLFTDQVNSLIT